MNNYDQYTPANAKCQEPIDTQTENGEIAPEQADAQGEEIL